MDQSDVLINFLDEVEADPRCIPASNKKLPSATEEDLPILEYYFNKRVSWLKDIVFKIMAKDLPASLNYEQISYFLDSPSLELKELAKKLLIIRNTGNNHVEMAEAAAQILHV